MGQKEVKVEFEGKETTVEGETSEDIVRGVKKFIRDLGVGTFVVLDKNNNALEEKDVIKQDRVLVTRNEQAGG